MSLPLPSSPKVRSPRPKASGGFTLIETLVCMFLLSLISGVLISITTQSSALVSQGATKISLHQRSRSALERMAPYIATAVPDQANGPAVPVPEKIKDTMTAGEITDPGANNSIEFWTTEDFLHPGYSPDASTVTPNGQGYKGWSLGDPHFLYRMRFDTSKGATYTTQASPPTTFPLGSIMLEKVDGGDPQDPRPLAHNVIGFRVYRITSSCMEVQVQTAATRKGPQGNQIDVIESESSILSVPSENYK